MITIIESEMNFGPYKKEDVFYIENSKIYDKIKNKVKITEFVLKKNSTLIFIEAKSSVPNPNGKNPENFHIYVDKIVEKMNNSLDIIVSSKLNILNDEDYELVNFIDLQELSNFKIAFRLVVKNAENEHLIPILDALKLKLASKIAIFNITVNVINEETARKYKLIN